MIIRTSKSLNHFEFEHQFITNSILSLSLCLCPISWLFLSYKSRVQVFNEVWTNIQNTQKCTYYNIYLFWTDMYSIVLHTTPIHVSISSSSNCTLLLTYVSMHSTLNAWYDDEIIVVPTSPLYIWRQLYISVFQDNVRVHSTPLDEAQYDWEVVVVVVVAVHQMIWVCTSILSCRILVPTLCSPPDLGVYADVLRYM